MAARRGWTRLTPAYRRRLEGKGISRAAWERGDDLRTARGHTPQRPRGAAPFPETLRFLSPGLGTEHDARVLTEFEELRRPRWLPRGLSFDVVAALSQLRGVPKDWAAVRFVPAPGGQPWGMVVTPRGSPRRDDGSSPYDQVILIPGGGAPGTGAREVLDLFTHPESSGVLVTDPRWRGWTSGKVDVAERPKEATTGYAERSEVIAEIDRLIAEASE